ncbi:hypothetical protein [Stutzerimonas balearica]|jgi:hypothetical protein|uniref:hypothetical protein n=1 Tax=Stutzerimonas balearica TaxID=74829 RepID=UPI0028A15C16|nr:hypothetical protein [Stutzerimonas balearica]
MQLIDTLRKIFISARREDEETYSQVLKEIQSGTRRDGLWAKALANSAGDSEKAKSFYIKYRAQAIKDERKLSESTSSKNNEKHNVDRRTQDIYESLKAKHGREPTQEEIDKEKWTR